MIIATKGFPGKGMSYDALPGCFFPTPVGAGETAHLLSLFSAQAYPRCFDCGDRCPRGANVYLPPQRFFRAELGKIKRIQPCRLTPVQAQTVLNALRRGR